MILSDIIEYCKENGHIDESFDFKKYHPAGSCVVCDEIDCDKCKGRMLRLFYYLPPVDIIPSKVVICPNCGCTKNLIDLVNVESNYWDDRYAKGKDSGKASKGKHRKWIWKMVNEFDPNLNSVIDVGCGDLLLWRSSFFNKTLIKCEKYIGIDISQKIIDKNQDKYSNRTFICENSATKIDEINAETVLCISLLFHIMDEKDFVNTLKNICFYSNKWIFIFTWVNNPFKNNSVTDGKYQYYRSLLEYSKIFNDQGFKLIKIMKCPHDNLNGMFIYKKLHNGRNIKGLKNDRKNY